MATTRNLDFAHAVADAIREIEPEAKVILFGSRARGDAEEDSDWDFLIIFDGADDWNRCMQLRESFYNVQLETGEVATCLYKTPMEWSDWNKARIPMAMAVAREGLHV